MTSLPLLDSLKALGLRLARRARDDGWRVPSDEIARVIYVGLPGSEGLYQVARGDHFDLLGPILARDATEDELYERYARLLDDEGIERDGQEVEVAGEAGPDGDLPRV